VRDDRDGDRDAFQLIDERAGQGDGDREGITDTKIYDRQASSTGTASAGDDPDFYG